MSRDGQDPPQILSRPQIRALQHDLLSARDQQILRVIDMVDKMPQRGKADDFIAPLRPRLAFLRPKRRLNFTRLLFQPLDSVIVASGAWRRDTLGVPRSALQPLSDVVRAHLGKAAAAFDDALAGLTTDHETEIGQFGPDLWSTGAAALAGATTPPDWTEASGLSPADFSGIVAIVAPSLLRAGRINRIIAMGPGELPSQRLEIEAVLQASLADGPTGFATLVTLLANRMPQTDFIFAAADEVTNRRSEPALRLAVDRAIDATIETLSGTLAHPPRLDQAADELRRMVIAIENLEAQCSGRVSRKTRLAQLRQSIDGNNRQQFTAALDSQLLLPAQSIVDADDTQIGALESTARDLRRFEAIARRIGGADHYDRHVKAALAALKPQPDEPVQTMVDRIRLIEILRGAEAAAAAMAG